MSINNSADGFAMEPLAGFDDTIVGQARVGVGNVLFGRDPASSPLDTAGELQGGGAPTCAIESVVASTAAVGGQDLGVVVARADNVATTTVVTEGSIFKALKAGASFKYVDRSGLAPATHDKSAPPLWFQELSGQRGHGVGPIERNGVDSANSTDHLGKQRAVRHRRG